MTKIPSHAKKVFSGILLDTYQWPQKMLDGSYKTFEMVRSYDLVKGICIVDNKILMTQEIQPDCQKLDFAGGIVLSGEATDKALIREVLEETGYTFTSSELICTTRSNIGSIEGYRYFYVCKGLTKVAEQELDIGGEQIDLVYFTFEEFVDILLQQKINKTDFIYRFLKTYYIPGKLEEFRTLLFS